MYPISFGHWQLAEFKGTCLAVIRYPLFVIRLDFQQLDFLFRHILLHLAASISTGSRTGNRRQCFSSAITDRVT